MDRVDIICTGMYVAVVIFRLVLLRRRWSVPLTHGPDYFLGVNVKPGFQEGPGRLLLRIYRIAIAGPYLLEALALAWVIAFGDPRDLGYLVLGGVALSATTTIVAVNVLLKRARAWEVEEARKPIATIAVPLSARNLDSYSNKLFEGTLAAAITASLLLQITRVGSLWHFFPLACMYAFAGMLLIKSSLVRWRLPAPAERAEEYLASREAIRRYFIRITDCLRCFCVLLVAIATVRAAFPEQRELLWRVTTAALIGGWLAMALWLVRESKRLAAISRSVKPWSRSRLRKPQPDPRRFFAAGFAYYNPDDPALLVRGPRWFVLNLANRLAYAYVVYAAGIAVLVVGRSLFVL